MGYLGDGGLGPTGQGPCYPFPLEKPPKPYHNLVIANESHDPSRSSKKVNP